ncbi:MAG: hypothetical protein PHS92_04725 [Candidatus Gracilibacteria bacterium]|nr:hypothetical protein [Candidatus Gracilibacteria bacterium]
MKIFPKILVVRYYELDGIEVTFSNIGTERYLNYIYSKLENEFNNNKHLESYEIYYDGEKIGKEKNKKYFFNLKLGKNTYI